MLATMVAPSATVITSHIGVIIVMITPSAVIVVVIIAIIFVVLLLLLLIIIIIIVTIIAIIIVVVIIVAITITTIIIIIITIICWHIAAKNQILVAMLAVATPTRHTSRTTAPHCYQLRYSLLQRSSLESSSIFFIRMTPCKCGAGATTASPQAAPGSSDAALIGLRFV